VLSKGSPASGQTVTWQSSAGLQPPLSTAITNSSGVAAKSLQVGPLSVDQQALASACLNGSNQCVSFTATGARPDLAYLESVAGTVQNIAVSATPAQITLRVRDTSGNPMAGATVTLFQSIFAWGAPCPPHGRCAQAQLLSNQVSTTMSAVDGTVTFTPASIPGVPTTVIGIAATGSTSTLNIAVEQHP